MPYKALVVAVIVASVASCGGSGNRPNTPGSSKEHPQQLVGNWEYRKAGRIIGSIQLEGSGRLIQQYAGDFTRFARWLGGGPDVAGVDTLTWAVGEEQGATRLCFSGNLIGQRLCFSFVQITADRIRIGYPGDEYVRVSLEKQQAPGGGSSLAPGSPVLGDRTTETQNNAKLTTPAGKGSFAADGVCADVMSAQTARGLRYLVSVYPCGDALSKDLFQYVAVGGADRLYWEGGAPEARSVLALGAVDANGIYTDVSLWPSFDIWAERKDTLPAPRLLAGRSRILRLLRR